MSYKFIEVSDILTEEHKLLGETFDLVANGIESAQNVAILLKGIHAMADAMMKLIDMDDSNVSS